MENVRESGFRENQRSTIGADNWHSRNANIVEILCSINSITATTTAATTTAVATTATNEVH